jgi:ATP-dependent Clp protease protease subunit
MANFMQGARVRIAPCPHQSAVRPLAADRERRVCLPNTRFIIHQPAGGARGPAADIAIQAKEILRTRERIARVIARQTGHTYEKVLADLERDYWMSAQEAIDCGIVSRVIDSHRDLTSGQHRGSFPKDRVQ